MIDELFERLAPLRGRRFESPGHKERLRRELNEAAARKRPRLPNWTVTLALLGAGATTAVAARAGFQQWRATFVEDGTSQEIILRALNLSSEPPLGRLRAEDGSLYELEEKDGRIHHQARARRRGARGRALKLVLLIALSLLNLGAA